MYMTIRALILPIAVTFALTGCGGGAEQPAPASSGPLAQARENTSAAAPDDTGETKSLLRTAQTVIETYYVDTQTYEGADLAALSKYEPSLADSGVAVGAAGADSFTLSRSNAAGVEFTIEKAGGMAQRTCGPTGPGCADGRW
jgi:hypothetical protein